MKKHSDELIDICKVSVISKPQILTIKQVSTITTLSRSTIYRMIKIGNFPLPISLSPSRSGFISDDIDNWVKSRFRASS